MPGIQFSGNFRTAPVWMADWAGREHLNVYPAKLDPTAFTNYLGVKVTTTGIVAQGAVAIPVTALAYPVASGTVVIAAGTPIIPKGTILRFGAGKFALVTADVLPGAVSVPVEALPTALAAADTAYAGNRGNQLFVPSGILVGRTFAERDANQPFGPAVTATDDEQALIAFDVPDLNINADVELYRPGERVYENYLPDYANLPGATLTKIRALYQTLKAVN